MILIKLIKLHWVALIMSCFIFHLCCLLFRSSSILSSPILFVSHFGHLPFWSSPILVVSHFGRLLLWSSPILVISHFGRLPIWLSSILAISHFGRLQFWSSSILVIFHFGRLPILSSSFLVVFHFVCLPFENCFCHTQTSATLIILLSLINMIPYLLITLIISLNW